MDFVKMASPPRIDLLWTAQSAVTESLLAFCFRHNAAMRPWSQRALESIIRSSRARSYCLSIFFCTSLVDNMICISNFLTILWQRVKANFCFCFKLSFTLIALAMKRMLKTCDYKFRQELPTMFWLCMKSMMMTLVLNEVIFHHSPAWLFSRLSEPNFRRDVDSYR